MTHVATTGVDLMGKSETLAMLKAVPIFEGLSKKELSLIYRTGSESQFKAGQTIVAEGETGVAFHLITAGKAKVTVGGRSKASLKAGDYFGEMALIDHGPRSATVKAESDLSTYSIASWNFLPLLDSMPSVAKKMLLILSKRLRASDSSLRG